MTREPEVERVPRDLEPERDLWPGIAARVRARRRAARWRLAALAAGLVLAVGALLWRGPSAEEVPLQASTKPTETVGLAAYAETDRTLAAIRDELQRSIEARQDRLPPETRTLVFENLRTIDRAIAEIERALDGAPGNAELTRTYIEYRQRQIGLLRQANQLATRL
jgi:hypothetical protein